ncbi:MAG: hypothetical protein HZA09_07535, partial [Nitrospirae bacterium]|nr:hypothetical protein [Nitrospirota bacterium]
MFYRKGTFLSILVLVTALFIGSTYPVIATEIIEPRSGKLLIEVTDLNMPAGAINLTVTRSFQEKGGQAGLLGTHWRLNWETRLIIDKVTNTMLVEDGPIEVRFTATAKANEYRNNFGEHLVVTKDGAIRTTTDGSKYFFDSEGRLLYRQDLNGNRITLKYGKTGRLIRIDGPRKSFLEFSFDRDSRLTNINSSRGEVVTYTYEKGKLTSVGTTRNLP